MLRPICLATTTLLLASLASPALAEETGDGEIALQSQAEEPPPPPGVTSPGGPPMGAPGERPVFDDTWVTIGIGAGLVPSYSGSDDYRLFPLPLIVGRAGGVGFSPNGAGLTLDFLSDAPSREAPSTSFSFGPTFRIRNDRNGQIRDDVVELAGDLDTALEVGVQGGVSFPGMLHDMDRVSLSTQVRWDILGAHEGMVIEPSVSYFTPLSRGIAVQLSANMSFVDDSFADYYYSVTPAASVATGLPEFSASGGLNSVGALMIGTVDLNGNLLDGGLNLFTIAGYSKLMGDAADTPYTATRGSASQFIGGIGVGYTF